MKVNVFRVFPEEIVIGWVAIATRYNDGSMQRAGTIFSRDPEKEEL
jgi:hypothetical protein